MGENEKKKEKRCIETDLVELKSVQQIVQFAVLGSFVDLDEVLLKPMKGQFGLIINVNLQRLKKRRPI
jgi:hypothetical protein